MPLVSDNIVTAWYSRSSWVYKSFAFLFQNPLWHTSVSTGFSLCPFFWLALFSVVIFRPLVYLTLSLRAIARVTRLGWALGAVDRFLGRILDMQEIHGLPTVMGSLLSALILLSAASLYDTVFRYTTWSIAGMLAIPAAMAAVFMPCFVYSAKHDSELNRCRVEIYARLAMVLGLVAAFSFFPADTFHALFHWPWAALCGILGAIWYCVSGIGWAIGYAALWIWHGIAFGLPSVWLSAAALLILLVYGWLAARFDSVASNDTSISAKELSQRRDRFLYACSYHNGRGSAKWWIKHADWFADLLLPYLGLADFDPCTMRDQLWSQIEARITEREAQEQAKAEARAAKCRAFTSMICRLFSPLVPVCKQIAIFCSAMWQTAKGLKQGACPYLRFHD